MRRIIRTILVVLTLGNMASAQEFGAIARVDPVESEIKDGWFGKTTVSLHLSQGVPFRVFHLNDPARLVVDFKEADWTGVSASDVLETEDGRISAVRFGSFRAGWSRMVLDLGEPMLPIAIGMPVDKTSGQAVLKITLKSSSAEEFAKNAGTPANANWAPEQAKQPVAKPVDDGFLVMIDPGHGGLDPGAVRDGVNEKDLMLTLSRGLAEALTRTGEAQAMLTRDDDSFVSLPARVSKAHQAGADLFISLHADALSNGQAQGATIYTLSDEASDAASEQLESQHNRADIIAGVDLTGSDDQVASVLIDLARQETGPRNEALVSALIEMIEASGAPLSKKQRKQAGFSVLKSADIPSVLIEVGFLSNPRDRANLRDPEWREVMIAALVEAILTWRADDLATRPLVRQ
jgi:N-acetylmuramoyl-L-alanine amidase